MRDPEMVARAHRAAVTLERAWERWRTRHGIPATPMPPVSSYVGYSMEEPWGRPRVVFGVDAHEAELLAALLDRHDGPPGAAGAAGDERVDGGGRETGREAAAPPGERARVPQPAPREQAIPAPGEPLTRAEREQAGLAGPASGRGGAATIAAELAGWASGELPGQASARLAAWEAIGGVPDPHQATLPGIDPAGIDTTAEPVTSG